ncbi:MAG: rhomboid family intramembrane serine protease [Pseudomonadota bacterium]
MVVPWQLQPVPVRLFVIACVLAEMLALAGALTGFGSQIRNAMVGLGGFWPTVLKGASPLFAAQPVTMFGTAAFLHGGPMHLFMNMVGLLWLGPMVLDRLGAAAFWPIAGLSALAAGGVFALLAQGSAPMVGASGVLFGFLGVVAVWQVLDALDRKESLAPLLGPSLLFIGLNVALTIASPASIAWQAHLGGFLGGALCGCLTWRNGLARPFS